MFDEIPVNRALTRELEEDLDFGTTIDDKCFFAQIGSQPIGVSISRLFAELHRPVPDEIKLYQRFEAWLIPHRVSIIRRNGNQEPTSVGLEVEYDAKGKTCSIVSLLPSFTFIERGHTSGQFHVTGSISATGEMKLPHSIIDTEILKFKKGGLDLGVSAGSEVGLNFSAKVVTPIISAVGVGSSRCEWRFDKQDEPLYGRDIETWSVVILPKREKQLAYRARFYFIARTLFFETRRESDWVNISCQLGT